MRLGFAVAMVILAGFACGDDGGFSRVETAELTVTDTAGGEDFRYLEFDNLTIPGSTSDVSFNVKRVGNDTLTIASVDTVFDTSGWIRPVAEIAPGVLETTEQEYKLRMERPNTSSGGNIQCPSVNEAPDPDLVIDQGFGDRYCGHVTVTAAAPNSKTITVYLLQSQVGGEASVVPDVVNFGGAPDENRHFEVDVVVSNTNPSAGSITLTSIEFSGAGVHSSALSFAGFPLPLVLDSATPSATYTIEFDPTTAEAFPAGVTAMFYFDGLSPKLVSILAATAAGPELSVSSDSLSFPNGTTASPESKELTVSNLGNATLLLNTLRIEPPSAAAAYTLSVSQMTVPRQNSEVLTVTYQPPTAESVNGTLRMLGSGGIEKDIALFGGQAAPSGAVNPDSIEFNAAPGESQEREFAISNSGAAALTVTGADLSGLSDEFSLTGLSFPVTVQPGELASATVQYARAADDIGVDVGNLILQTNNPGTGEIIVLVRNNNDESALPPSAVITQTPEGTVAAGSEVTLSAADSDANGGTITAIEWTLLEKPVGSSATLSSPSAETTTFTADQAGNYRVQLVVSNGVDGSTVRTITVAQ
jgi:hypothetical protein